MNGEIKISELSVAQYMCVINDLPASKAQKDLSEQDNAILDKFRAATKSYHLYRTANGWDSEKWIKYEPRDISYAWGSFNAILVVFQYLNDDTKNTKKALSLTELFNRFINDPKVNEPQYDEKITGKDSDRFLFKAKEYIFTHTAATFRADVEVQYTNSYDAYRDNFNKILGGCTKDSTISTVIRHLEPYVLPEALAGFREMARRGFDVDLLASQEMVEQETIQTTQCNRFDADISPKPKKLDGPLWAKCEQLFDAGARQIVFTGAPGTGKTFTAEVFAEYKLWEYADRKGGIVCDKQMLDEHIKTVQFHSGYDYSDFVEGLRPVHTGVSGEMTFVRLDGQFKAFCRKILNNPDKNAPYFFIIDEINRADLSRVFGELMFCLDESKRPASPEDTAGKTVVTQYSNLPTYQISENGIATKMENDDYKKGFYIPKNLCILATMNDIDRSVESFDFALRRRFKWIEAKADEEMEPGLLGMLGCDLPDDVVKELSDAVKGMNAVITGDEGQKLRLTSDYHIGHAYFEKYNGENLPDIWENQIKQILREYCRGRANSSDVNNFIEACRKALLVDKGEK